MSEPNSRNVLGNDDSIELDRLPLRSSSTNRSAQSKPLSLALLAASSQLLPNENNIGTAMQDLGMS